MLKPPSVTFADCLVLLQKIKDFAKLHQKNFPNQLINLEYFRATWNEVFTVLLVLSITDILS